MFIATSHVQTLACVNYNPVSYNHDCNNKIDFWKQNISYTTMYDYLNPAVHRWDLAKGSRFIVFCCGLLRIDDIEYTLIALDKAKYNLGRSRFGLDCVK